MIRGRPKSFDRDVALRAALDVFWDRGYDRASMATLVGEMGVGRQSVYDTFGDKRALFLAAIDRYVAERDVALDELLAAGRGGAPIDGVGRLLGTLARRARESRRGCLLVNAATEFGGDDDVIAARLAEARMSLEERLRASLVAARDAGELRTDVDVDAWTTTLVTALYGAMVQARTPGGDARADASLAHLWTTLTARAWGAWDEG